ncbi:MAG: hypothetical protein NPIRA01_36020 [Nitrospirales bacterium]|nr:MAG: hypothetical protein NPIRA01_36020 [Nitrospirales bacterium]
MRELTAEWMIIYNEHRPHKALQGACNEAIAVSSGLFYLKPLHYETQSGP